MPRGRTAKQLAHIRSKRRPFSDVREGRLLRQIRRAFLVRGDEEVITSYLVSWCYPAAYVLGGVKSWHRTNTIKAARRVATLVRRGAGEVAGKGRPLIWRAIAELMVRWGHRDATMVLLAYRHGLRAAEPVDLRWEQLDLEHALLHVRRLNNGNPATHPLTCGLFAACSASRARRRRSCSPQNVARRAAIEQAADILGGAARLPTILTASIARSFKLLSLRS